MSRTIPDRSTPPVLKAVRVRRGALIRQFRESVGVTRPEVTERLSWSRDLVAIYELGHAAMSDRQQERVLDAIRAVAAEKAKS